MKEILKSLGINENNYGACIGAGNWSVTTDVGVLNSVNPANGEVIANVYQCSEDDYEKVITESQIAFEEWRMVPAPSEVSWYGKWGKNFAERKVCWEV